MHPYSNLLKTIDEYLSLGIEDQIDYKKFYLYSIITHSTAIEGSTVTELENQLLFDEGITASGRSLQEQIMNLDLKSAYDKAIVFANQKKDYSAKVLCYFSSLVMKNTGNVYNTSLGTFSAANGDLRLVNVSAGFSEHSYLAFQKVPQALDDFCKWLNIVRKSTSQEDIIEAYKMSFIAHYRLVTIHPWADGNGRMVRLLMNMLQWEFRLIPVKVLKDQKLEYIEALNISRNTNDETYFANVMLDLHNRNLRSTIEKFKKTSSQDVTQNVTQNNDYDFTLRQREILHFIEYNDTISANVIAERLGVSVRSIRRDIENLRKKITITWVGSSKSGHWEISTKESHKE